MYRITASGWTQLNSETQSSLKALLLTADPSWEQIQSYVEDSLIFILHSEQRQMVAQLCLFRQTDTAEIKNLSVDMAFQKQGLAKKLLIHVIEWTRQQQFQTLTVKTGNSSLDQLALYQKVGFRMTTIEQDAFKDYPEEIYENGIRCLDQVVLTMNFSVA